MLYKKGGLRNLWEKKPCILNALQESTTLAPCLSRITPRASRCLQLVYRSVGSYANEYPARLSAGCPDTPTPLAGPYHWTPPGKVLPLQRGGPPFGRQAQRRGMKGRRISAPRHRAETFSLLFRVPTATPPLQANLLFEKLGRPRRSPPGPGPHAVKKPNGS